jgi:hypothetical protein
MAKRKGKSIEVTYDIVTTNGQSIWYCFSRDLTRQGYLRKREAMAWRYICSNDGVNSLGEGKDITNRVYPSRPMHERVE